MLSTGIPDNWSAAAVVYALIEGLAGIKDTGIAFDEALLAPRWGAAGVQEVSATAKYEASGGYMSYEYQKDSDNITMVFTGSSRKTKIKLLLPQEGKVSSVFVNGKKIRFNHEKIEDSRYVAFDVKKLGVHSVKLKLDS
jgi:hypothetical protein